MIHINISTTVPDNISGFTRQARQQADVPHCLDCLFRALTVPIIPVLLSGRCAAPGPMHSTDATAANRRRTTALPRSFRFGFAPRRVVGALHGVDGHFDLVTPPTPTGTSRLRLAGAIRFSLLGRRHTDGTSVRRSIPFWTQICPRLNQHRCLGRTGARPNWGTCPWYRHLTNSSMF